MQERPIVFPDAPCAAFAKPDTGLLREYLATVMTTFREAPLRPATAFAPIGDTADLIFSRLCCREYCYLSKSRSGTYRPLVVPWIRQAEARREPIPFNFDIGGGYHAGIDPDHLELTFEVGIGELLMLRQIQRFHADVTAFYPPGVRFRLVVDNLCALLVNDVPLAQMSRYCEALRALIRQVGLEDRISLYIESEQMDSACFATMQAKAMQELKNGCSLTVTPQQHANVQRFLGRTCDVYEAHQRMARYHSVTMISDNWVRTQLPGIRMAQRASDGVLAFRSFPGGDSRLQSGQLALVPGTQGRLKPVLITTRNVSLYELRHFAALDLLPPALPQILVGAPKSPSEQ